MNSRAAGLTPGNQGELRRVVELIAQLYREWGEKDKAMEWLMRFEDMGFPKDPLAPSLPSNEKGK